MIIYFATNARILLPKAFSENLQTYFRSHSKPLVEHNNSVAPSLKFVFDNEQVIGKTRLIKSENKVPLSAITSHTYLQIDPENNVKSRTDLCPRIWFFKNPLSENVKNQVTQKFEPGAWSMADVLWTALLYGLVFAMKIYFMCVWI